MSEEGSGAGGVQQPERAATGPGGGYGQPAFALTREHWTFSALWDHALASFKREWLGLSVAALVLMLILYGASFVGGLLVALVGELVGSQEGLAISAAVGMGLLMVVQFMLQGALSLGLMRIALDVLHGERADIGRLFSQLRKAPAYLGAVLGLTLLLLVPVALLGAVGFVLHSQGVLAEAQLIGAVLLATLLLGVPFVYYVLPIYFLAVEFALEDRPQLLQSVRTCYRVAQGSRLAMLGVSLLGGALLMAGMMLCFVGMLPAFGFMNLLMGGLYLALRRSAQLQPAPA